MNAMLFGMMRRLFICGSGGIKMRLSNIKPLGRFKRSCGKTVNLYRGRWKERGVDLIFFYRSGLKQFVTDKDFYEEWRKVEL
jgi:hypothetical protein